ncbi:alginate export family protein [Tabrizicola sp. J26]|uniref:alginate export family protein n=1 Tax=Alitabrizicola rongguiensis TaxID=2909234 RepID=UPI001F27CFA8|nr:alginate export family protein [Tabrizicola rongguiensis]MCF1710991.1 alginate export family protein [Tabrizicola rongguiensis]
MLLVLADAPGAFAQVGLANSGPFEQRRIESVQITIANPTQDAAFNQRIEDAVRRGILLFPDERYNDDAISLAITQIVRRNPQIASIDFEPLPAALGGVDVNVTVKLGDGVQPPGGRGMAASGKFSDFPLLLDRNGTVLKFKLDVFTLMYGNNNAWYGQPGPMLAGNPLADGPAGAGWSDWAEGYLQYGIYGITPLTNNLYAYGNFSVITSGSSGQELFTNLARGYTYWEDAYVGLVGGNVDSKGNRLTYNLSVGRQRFTLANGFLIANTAANGWNRAALQANARWASDLLVLGEVAYNQTKLQAFYLDPDELPILDTDTRIAGLNLETTPVDGLMLGMSYLTVPQSTAAYYSPTGGLVGTREGMQLWDARFNWTANPEGVPGPFIGGEAALQTNRNFGMNARAGWAEVGYSFAKAKWSPAISYRIAYFSGDDPDTPTYERWDPLLSGGTGEQWVQGMSHFKVVQDSNVIAQRIQGRLRVTPKIEVVPQLWVFRADTLNNVGGNPALSTLTDSTYGYEANVTVKWYKSRNLYVHGALGFTVPGEGTKAALGGDASNWLAAMLFVRYSF